MLDGRPNEKGVLYLGDGSWGRIRKVTDRESRPYLAVADESYHLSVHRIEGQQQFHVALSDTGFDLSLPATAVILFSFGTIRMFPALVSLLLNMLPFLVAWLMLRKHGGEEGADLEH